MSNDNKARVVLEFDSNKLMALRMYMHGKGMEVELELGKTMDQFYDKYVPNSVKDFIAMKAEEDLKRIKPYKRNLSISASGNMFEDNDSGS